jgi:hypothetical protein
MTRQERAAARVEQRRLERELSPIERERKRSRRVRAMRSRTLNMKRLPKRDLDFGRRLYPDAEGIRRPSTRAECIDSARPCPFVSCKHHLYLDVSPRTGSIKLNFPDLEPGEMRHSCSLDVADCGEHTMERVASLMNIVRERVRQIEDQALIQIRLAAEKACR